MTDRSGATLLGVLALVSACPDPAPEVGAEETSQGTMSGTTSSSGEAATDVDTTTVDSPTTALDASSVAASESFGSGDDDVTSTSNPSGAESGESAGEAESSSTGQEPAECGNGILEADEACDDGMDNGVADGCDHACALVCVGACPLRVDPEAEPGGDGASWDTAQNDLSAAIEQQWAAGGGPVWVRARTLDGGIVMRPGVSLFGGFEGFERSPDERAPTGRTRLVGGYHVVVAESHARLDGFTITDGAAEGAFNVANEAGGGIVADRVSNFEISNCEVENNSATQRGGGMFVNEATVSIHSVRFSGNVATTGGALYATDSMLDIRDSAFDACTASGSGGAIALVGTSTSASLERLWIQESTAEAGGGIFIDGATLELSWTTLQGNAASSTGGGIHNRGSSTSTFVDVRFIENEAGGAPDQGGGGVWNEGSTARFRDCQFYRNDGALAGGGMYLMGGSVTVINSVFASNNAHTGGGVFAAAGEGTFHHCTFAFNDSATTNAISLNEGATARVVSSVLESDINSDLVDDDVVLEHSCTSNQGSLGSPPPLLDSVRNDRNGDGIDEYTLVQTSTNPCLGAADAAHAESLGLAWSSMTTSLNRCLDAFDPDAGVHYPSDITTPCPI